ncbi:MAG: hypothetical protein GX139_01560 [Armatimonadetes bacterium]|jgi:hypothetical protein|nr:hypothetical protein [Armatimonadota bacterium]
MAIHLFKDAELTQQVSEGTMTSPDSDTYNGTDGESKDRELFLANEQTTLASAINDTTTTLQIVDARFTDGEAIVIGSEQMLVVSGGGTTQLTFERGYAGTTSGNHSSGTKVYSAYNYTGLLIQPIDNAGPSEATWVKLAANQAGLDSAVAGESLNLGDKAHNATLSFWRRVTVPAGTPVQNKTDIKLRVTGTESPVI